MLSETVIERGIVACLACWPTLTSTGPIVPRDEGLGQRVRTSLFYSFKVLSASLMFLILGLSLVLPWGLVVYVGYRVVRWLRRTPIANRSSQIS